MLDWKKRATEQCEKLGLSYKDNGNYLLVNGRVFVINGVEDLDAKYEKSLNDLVDYRVYQIKAAAS